MKRFTLALILLFLTLALSSCRPESAALGSTRTRDSDGMVMVYVPAGQFAMGSTASEVDRALQQCSDFRVACIVDQFDDEMPSHLATLAAFWLDGTEVANAQYHRCVEAGRCTPTSCPEDAAVNGDTQPVVCLSWDQAGAYCAWAGGRLPTESEWEYAARGTARLTYPWGNDFDSTRASYCDASCPFSWADMQSGDGYTQTAPVGSFPTGASWCGALDMAGNAWEWVQDWYAPYTSEPVINPVTEQGASGRVLRGGSWDLDPAFLRSAVRNWGEPAASSNVTGFRCVVPIAPQANP